MSFDRQGANTVLPKLERKTRIEAENLVSNTSATLYTVPAGKTFYLSSATINATLVAANSSGNGFIEHDTGGDASFITIGRIYLNTSALIDRMAESMSIQISVPQSFIAGTVFRVRSGDLNYYVWAHIFGWEE